MPTQNQRRRPSLSAEFGTPGDARAAIEALENHGIDGLEITILGGLGEDHRRPADRRALVHVSGRVAKGAVLGALAGAAVLGVVGVIAAIAGAPAAVIVAFVLLGAGLGAAVGAFWGVERGVGMSEDWEKTFQEPASATKPMRIGVYTNDDAATARARRVLEGHRPLDIRDQTTGSVTR
jgi:O-antigen ligase